MKLPYAEPFHKNGGRNFAIYTRTKEIWLQEAHYNLFNLKSSQVLSICLPIQEQGSNE